MTSITYTFHSIAWQGNWVMPRLGLFRVYELISGQEVKI
jgi:hypothetical protein